MCRGYKPNERKRLFIKGFYLDLAFPLRRKVLPDSLTLHFLPRINGSFLEINGSSIRPDMPSFITMHRILSPEKLNRRNGVVYGSGEKLKATEGSRFEIYLADVKLLKGFIRKGESENWELECKCLLEEEVEVEFLREIDICVEVEGGENISMNKKVEMRRRRKMRRFRGLEEIPEEREREEEEEVKEEKESRCCCDECSGCGGGGGSGSGDSAIVTEGGDCDVHVLENTEDVNWAVDVGIWVVCLGFGYLVTKASYKRLRRTRLLF